MATSIQDLESAVQTSANATKKQQAAAQKAPAPRETPDQALATQIRELAIKREGNILLVPEHIGYDVAIGALLRAKQDDEREVDLIEDFDLTMPEGALALYLTLNELYGFVDKMTTPGTLWSPEKPPLLLNVQTSPTTGVTIPWGRFGVPGVEGWIETRFEMRRGFPYFQIKAHVKGRCQSEIKRLCDALRARKDHFYAGHAIRVVFPDPQEAASLSEFFPEFLTLPDVTREQLIFSEDIEELVDVALFTPITQTAFCRERGIPLKRGILLEGPYGVGKTLAVNVAAGLCRNNGWTFIELVSVKDLARAYQFALRHQPALIFCEDIDEVLQDDEDRTSEINAILNSVDGIESKNSEIMTVFTTNDVGALTKAMLRPGRIDTVVPVRAPDASAAERLIRLYGGDTVAPTEDLTLAGQLLAGHNAAVVREVVNRSKLSAVRRITHTGQTLTLIARDIELSAKQMEAHSRLIEEEERDERSDIEKAADILGTKLLTAGRREPGPSLTEFLGEERSAFLRKTNSSQAAE